MLRLQPDECLCASALTRDRSAHTSRTAISPRPGETHEAARTVERRAATASNAARNGAAREGACLASSTCTRAWRTSAICRDRRFSPASHGSRPAATRSVEGTSTNSRSVCQRLYSASGVAARRWFSDGYPRSGAGRISVLRILQRHASRSAPPLNTSSIEFSRRSNETGCVIIAALCSSESSGGSAQATLRSSTRFHANGLVLCAAATKRSSKPRSFRVEAFCMFVMGSSTPKSTARDYGGMGLAWNLGRRRSHRLSAAPHRRPRLSCLERAALR